MRLKKTILIGYALASLTSSFAQEAESRHLRLCISAIELGRSGYFGGEQNLSLEQMKNFTNLTSFGLLDLSDYNVSAHGLAIRNQGWNLAATFDFTRGMYTDFWGDPGMRFGLSFHQSYIGLNNYSQEYRYSMDSLFYTYQSQNNAIAVDSIRQSFVDFGVGSSRLRLNTAFLIKTDNRRINFYAGLGLGVGASLNSTLFVYQSETTGFRERNPQVDNNQWLLNSLGRDITESSLTLYRGRMITDFTLSIPMGIDIKLATGLSLFGEVAPLATLTKYSGAPRIWNMGYTGMFGLRVKFY
jgi:hypothetical protein